MFPAEKPRGTLRSRGNKTHCFPWGQSFARVFSIPPNSKVEKTAKKLFALRQLAHKYAAVARNTTMCESKVHVVSQRS